jgi:putative ABC transport system substrate-binding protein
MLPKASVMALLINPTSPTVETQSREMQAVAGTLGLRLHVLHANAERDFDTVFTSLAQLKVGGLVIGSADPFFASRIEQLAALTVQHAGPTDDRVSDTSAAPRIIQSVSSLVARPKQVAD